MSGLKKIKLDEIIPISFIPERVDLGDLTEIVNSIKIKEDVDIPLRVRPSKTNPGKYERIWGKRRQEACSIIGLKEVTCIVEDSDDDECFRLSATENIYHKDLNPIEEAKFFEAWSKHCNLNYNEIAGELGLRDPSYVYNRTGLLGLPQTIQDKILTGKNFGVHHGLLLLQVKDPSLQEKLADEVIEKGLTVRELEKKVKEITKPKEEVPPAIPAQKAPEVKEEPTRPEATSVAVATPVTVKPEEIQPSPAAPTEPQVITKPMEEQAKELTREALKHGIIVKPYEDLLKEVEALRGRLEDVEYFLQSIAGEYEDNCPFCHKSVCIKVNPDPDKKILNVSLTMFETW
jgi:ParB family chromosome partitioning protein